MHSTRLVLLARLPLGPFHWCGRRSPPPPAWGPPGRQPGGAAGDWRWPARGAAAACRLGARPRGGPRRLPGAGGPGAERGAPLAACWPGAGYADGAVALVLPARDRPLGSCWSWHALLAEPFALARAWLTGEPRPHQPLPDGRPGSGRGCFPTRALPVLARELELARAGLSAIRLVGLNALIAMLACWYVVAPLWQ